MIRKWHKYMRVYISWLSRSSVCLVVRIRVCLSVYLSVCMYVYQFVCHSVCLYICLPVFINLSVCLSICLTVRAYVSMYICMYIFGRTHWRYCIIMIIAMINTGFVKCNYASLFVWFARLPLTY